ncbi:MAG: holA [Alphaproteobacteria bacterium]|nr:holA [Alphaproteobacteria bacterium]
MKIAGDPLQYCRAVPKTMRGVLLYGPNEVLIDEAVRILQKTQLPDGEKNDFSITVITHDMLKQNPAILAEEYASFGFFASEKIIHLRDADDVFVKPIQEALSAPGAGHFLIVEAGELTPKSALRAWGEKAPDIATLACYALEGATLQRFVQAQFQQQNARISNDATAMLIDRLGNDVGPLKNIIAQLVDYAGGEAPVIQAGHVEALLADQVELELDSVVQAIASGLMPQLDRALHNLAASGTSMIAVLRACQNYFYRLRIVQAAVKNGESQEGAMARLRPPVFFKLKQSFSRHLRDWSMARIDRALALLLDLEAQCKKTGTPEVLLVQQRLILLARENARGRI